jgi:hypothetical protein
MKNSSDASKGHTVFLVGETDARNKYFVKGAQKLKRQT